MQPSTAECEGCPWASAAVRFAFQCFWVHPKGSCAMSPQPSSAVSAPATQSAGLVGLWMGWEELVIHPRACESVGILDVKTQSHTNTIVQVQRNL